MNSRYGPQRGTTDRVSSQPHRAVPVTVDSPAAISTVQEIVEAVTERLMEGSRANLRRETRPLKYSIAGIGAMVVATCTWGASQVSSWNDSMREQILIEAKQVEQDAAMATHLEAPHVTPEQFEAMAARLTAIEQKLDDALVHNEPPVPVRVNVKSKTEKISRP